MSGSRVSLPPRGLLALIVGVTLVPLAMLLWVGWRLLEQDQMLEEQQVRQRLAGSADQAVTAIDLAIGGWERQLTDERAVIPVGAVRLVIRGDAAEVTPRSRVAFLPGASPLREPPSSAIDAGNEAEHRIRDRAAATAAVLALARSADRATRADGQFRLARRRLRAGDTNGALTAYAALLDVDDVGIGGVPAALAARYARCRLLEDHARGRELTDEARSLLRDLREARWPLTAPVYRLYLTDAERWSGEGPAAHAENERLAEALAVVFDQWRGGAAGRRVGTGREIVSAGGESFAVLWRSDPDSVVALVTTAAFARERWLLPGEEVARAQQVMITAGSGSGSARGMTRPVVTRSQAETQLPWSISVSAVDPTARVAEFVVRRQLLMAGFVLLVTMALVAAYLIVRAVSRELAAARL